MAERLQLESGPNAVIADAGKTREHAGSFSQLNQVFGIGLPLFGCAPLCVCERALEEPHTPILCFCLVSLLRQSPHILVNAAPASQGKVVTLDYGSFQGTVDGNIAKYAGVPFAAPPVGKLRFAPPQPPVPFSGIHQATNFGLTCPQQAANLTVSPAFHVPSNVTSVFSFPNIPTSEDCLFINIITPASINNNTLSVVFWIFGGGFEVGDTPFNVGDPVVNRSIALGEPVVYVSANYRLNALGFLGGKEAQAAGAGNLGLKDQQFSMKWVQKYIGLFGGDPEKVTIWGESAGSISAAMHLVNNNGNTDGLFRAAVMQSGTLKPLYDIKDKQSVYDQLVSDTGCGGSQDTFACLRDTPFDTLMAAVNNTPSLSTYRSMQIAYEPTIDGDFIAHSPTTSVSKGLYAKIPIITGDTDDEGTIFALSSLNVTTEAEFREYVSIYLPGITDDQLDAISIAYPSDVTKGSPFDTGTTNAITPQYKRLAAFEGDLIFQGPRRFLMQATAKTQPTYGFLYKRDKGIPLIASHHGDDVTDFYGLEPGFIGVDALLNFVNNLDPNIPKRNRSTLSSTHWPLYNTSSNVPSLFTFIDPAPSVEITADDFRASPMKILTNISIELHPM
ncbi:carotenoid ester lipase precursor [Cyathus striatus]|nr:carotenoid ester lipase precursor [Cyathus striatus]